MRVRTGRFLRWATPLPSREQMVVFLRRALVQKKMRRPQEQALDQDARDQTGKICTEQSTNIRCVSNNVGVEKSRKYFSYQWLVAYGALGGRSHLLRFQWLIRMSRIERCPSNPKVPFTSCYPVSAPVALTAGSRSRRVSPSPLVL